MKVTEIVSEGSNFNFNKSPKTDQMYGDLEVMHHVDDIFDYVQQKHYPIQQIKLSLILNADSTLPGDSDEPDNSPEFRARVKGLTLRDFQQGTYPPILVEKNKNKYSVIDGRHRVLQLVYHLKTAQKNPMLHTIRGYVIDRETIEKNILSVADKYNRDIPD